MIRQLSGHEVTVNALLHYPNVANRILSASGDKVGSFFRSLLTKIRAFKYGIWIHIHLLGRWLEPTLLASPACVLWKMVGLLVVLLIGQSMCGTLMPWNGNLNWILNTLEQWHACWQWKGEYFAVDRQMRPSWYGNSNKDYLYCYSDIRSNPGFKLAHCCPNPRSFWLLPTVK